MKWICREAWIALLLVRLPSVVQPAGGDQGLYAYVGQRIAHGELPYRDAWDQKPPAIHYTYALMYSFWPRDPVIGSTDLAVTIAVAWLLLWIGRRLALGPGVGETSSLLYLLLANPAFGRLGGVRTRAQCETFIALLAAGALALLLRSTGRRLTYPRQEDAPAEAGSPAIVALAGTLLGLAVLYKYNAVTYTLAAVALLAALEPNRPRVSRSVGYLVLGAAVPALAVTAMFLAGGAFNDLVQATVSYNLRYSGETYSGVGGFLRYLVTFPVRLARLDALWFLGGLGSIWLGARFLRSHAGNGRLLIVAPAWIAAACLSIAINSGRGLPQYFIQAQPALALAAGAWLSRWWQEHRPLGRLVTVTLLTLAVLRINAFDNAWSRSLADFRYATGRMSRPEYLERFGGQRAGDKFSALAVENLGAYLRAHTAPDDPVFVFGFAGGAYVKAERRSASRFFWSRPIIIGFNEGVPGYGAAGLLAELNAGSPRIVVLQHRDWDSDTEDSATFFLRTPQLANWLRRGYRPAEAWQNFEIWTRGGR